MPEQTKIKELLKDLERRVFTNFETEEPSKEIKIIGKTKLADIDSFIQLKQAVKSIRKENNRLEDQNKYIVDILCMVASRQMPIFNNSPIAEFKCAKTNKPERIGSYPCIVMGNKPYFSIATWYDDKWVFHSGSEVIAFTETDPGEIINALNKEK